MDAGGEIIPNAKHHVKSGRIPLGRAKVPARVLWSRFCCEESPEVTHVYGTEEDDVQNQPQTEAAY